MKDQIWLDLWKDVKKHTLLASYLCAASYPWEILSNLGAIIHAIGEGLPTDEYERHADDVWIARTAHIAATACIQGPCIIGHGTELRPGAYLRGNTVAGDEAVIGNSTELKNCILFDGVQVPHFNYVGDSILGYRAHLGAGAVTSNVKSDRSDVIVRIEQTRIPTGRHKLGAILGDRVEVGCHTVLNPGCVIGRGSVVYPGISLRGYVEGGCIYKGEGNVVRKR